MTREDYNLNRKPNPALEEKLCTWNFCDTCINCRIRHGMPIPELRSHGTSKPYFRYIDQGLKPAGRVRQELT